MTQDQAFEFLKLGGNVFLTGSAGTGKTFLLNKYISYLKEKGIKAGITASTGIAATHIDGRTIHSWAKIGIKKSMADKSIERLARNPELNERVNEARVLIIDEISMLDARRLDLIDKVCRVIKEPFQPFGGIKVVMCGDFFQLPPVEENDDYKFVYESMVWKNSEVRVCYLDKQYRQDDVNFINVLNKIRDNEAGQNELNILRTRLNKDINYFTKPTKMYALNKDVDIVNDYELDRIPKNEIVFRMSERGPIKLVNFLKRNCLAPERLRLKTGATIMFVRNNFGKGYVNGTLGKVIDFSEDTKYPIVRTKSGQEIVAEPASWNIEGRDYNILARITQIPLRLAWAITIHKSQGMSLDAAEIDLSKSFEHGMGYVALSRVRTLDGIRLMGINELSLKVNPLIVEKDKEFKELSKRLEDSL